MLTIVVICNDWFKRLQAGREEIGNTFEQGKMEMYKNYGVGECKGGKGEVKRGTQNVNIPAKM